MRCRVCRLREDEEDECEPFTAFAVERALDERRGETIANVGRQEVGGSREDVLEK